MYKVIHGHQGYTLWEAASREEAKEMMINFYHQDCEPCVFDDNGNDITDELFAEDWDEQEEEPETYTAIRYCFKYGCETDELVPTFKVFDSIEKAIKYAHRYAGGLRFCMCEIEDSNGKTIYEVMDDGRVFDYRNV